VEVELVAEAVVPDGRHENIVPPQQDRSCPLGVRGWGVADTTERVLRLLSLLQSRPVWTGPELAARLGVTVRSIRRDVERLRALGYPVNATQGSGGGYQLGAGRALPPLLLDDEEAVAIAVSLRLAAAGSVTGASEAALRTLAKLDQVMPPRLRSEVRALQDVTATLVDGAPRVDGEVLMTLARACRDTVRVRFGYARPEEEPAPRTAEPVRLVATDRRWYLMAFDLDRADWRTFRLDRMSDVEATGWRFAPREHPDPVEHVHASITASPYRHVARVGVHAPAEEVRRRVTVGSARVVADGRNRSVLTAGADSLSVLALHLAALDLDLEVLEPPGLLEELDRLTRRLLRVAGGAGAAG
jgi:predicted DNA-binding transcriptional regulator YafY